MHVEFTCIGCTQILWKKKKTKTLLCRIFHEEITLCVVHVQPLLPTSCCLSNAGVSESLISALRMASSSSSLSFLTVSVFDFLLTSRSPLCRQQQHSGARCTGFVLACHYTGLIQMAHAHSSSSFWATPEAWAPAVTVALQLWQLRVFPLQMLRGKTGLDLKGLWNSLNLYWMSVRCQDPVTWLLARLMAITCRDTIPSVAGLTS